MCGRSDQQPPPSFLFGLHEDKLSTEVLNIHRKQGDNKDQRFIATYVLVCANWGPTKQNTLKCASSFAKAS